MDFSGLFNFGYNFGVKSWFFPSFTFKPIFDFSPWNFFSSLSFPSFNIFDNYLKPSENVDRFQPAEVPALKSEQPRVDNIVTVPSIKVPDGKVKKIAQKKSVSVKSNKSSNKEIKQRSDNLQIKGYDADAGIKLAKTAMEKAVGWTGYCARYVKTAIRDSGLGEYVSGHAFQMPKILRKNKNFRELSKYQVDVKKLPAGCILVYGKGVSGYSSAYGHVEITTGDGRAVSDGITKNLRNNPTAIFMPVENGNLA